MTSKLNLLFCLVLGFLYSASMNSQVGLRYVDDIYENKDIAVNLNLPYGITPLGHTPLQAFLSLDYYYSVKDTTIDRPAVFLVHGGGFYTGSKNDNSIQKNAVSLAKKGYAVFAISYRLLGRTYKNPTVVCNGGKFNDTSWYWVMQDINAAIKAVTANKERFKMNPLKVFLFGESAGAISVLNFAYSSLNEINATTPFDIKTHFLFGDLDRTTFPAYKSESYEILGVASAAGALSNPNYLNTNDTVPVVMLHNPCEEIVPYKEEENGVKYSVGVANCKGVFYGSKYIYDQMNDKKNWPSAPDHKLYVTCDVLDDEDIRFKDHGIRAALVPFYEEKVPLFFHNVLKGHRKNNSGIVAIDGLANCSFNSCNSKKIVANSLTTKINAYPNPTKTTSTVNLSALAGHIVTFTVFNNEGKTIKSNQVNVVAGNHILDVELGPQPSGLYFIKLSWNGNEEKVIKIIKL